jgi:hypothetical protein
MAITWKTAGARRITKTAGKMNSRVGIRIMVAAFWAFSSAFCFRLIRRVSEWDRRLLTRLAPKRSDWPTTEARLSASSRSVRWAKWWSASPGL